MRRRTEIIKGIFLFVGIIAALVFQFARHTDPMEVRITFLPLMLGSDLFLMSPGIALALIAWIGTRIQRRRHGGILVSDSGYRRVLRLVILIGGIGTVYGAILWKLNQNVSGAFAVAGVFGAIMLIVAIVGSLGLLLESRMKKRCRPTVSPMTAG